MQRRKFLYFMAAVAATAPAAHAAPVLIAKAELTATAAGPEADLSGLSGALENNPSNLLGGLGST